MSREFTELTVKEMKRVLASLPNPLDHQFYRKGSVFQVMEPMPSIVDYSNGDSVNNNTLNTYSFKVVNDEWVLL